MRIFSPHRTAYLDEIEKDLGSDYLKSDWIEHSMINDKWNDVVLSSIDKVDEHGRIYVAAKAHVRNNNISIYPDQIVVGDDVSSYNYCFNKKYKVMFMIENSIDKKTTRLLLEAMSNFLETGIRNCQYDMHEFLEKYGNNS